MSLASVAPPVRDAVDVAKTVVAVVRDRQLPFLAGALGYAAFLSLAPCSCSFWRWRP